LAQPSFSLNKLNKPQPRLNDMVYFTCPRAFLIFYLAFVAGADVCSDETCGHPGAVMDDGVESMMQVELLQTESKHASAKNDDPETDSNLMEEEAVPTRSPKIAATIQKIVNIAQKAVVDIKIKQAQIHKDAQIAAAKSAKLEKDLNASQQISTQLSDPKIAAKIVHIFQNPTDAKVIDAKLADPKIKKQFIADLKAGKNVTDVLNDLKGCGPSA